MRFGPSCPSGLRANSETMVSASTSGSGLVIDPRMKPNTAALAPMPKAMVSSNTNVRPGVRARLLVEVRRCLSTGRERATFVPCAASTDE